MVSDFSFEYTLINLFFPPRCTCTSFSFPVFLFPPRSSEYIKHDELESKKACQKGCGIVRITGRLFWFRGEIKIGGVRRGGNVHVCCCLGSLPVRNWFTSGHWLLFRTPAAGLCSGVFLCYCWPRGKRNPPIKPKVRNLIRRWIAVLLSITERLELTEFSSQTSFNWAQV